MSKLDDVFEKLLDVEAKGFHRNDRPGTYGMKDRIALDEAVIAGKQQIKDLMLEIVGDDYKPSQLDNDKRYTRFIPPNSEAYVSKAEALAANYEFSVLRQKIEEL